MALIFSLSYHHHDPGLLQPVTDALTARGHNVVKGSAQYEGLVHFQAFLETTGPRAVLLVAANKHPHHQPGQDACRKARDAGLKSITIQHGIPLNEDVHYSAADVICIWGDRWKGKIITDGGGEVVTGNPALDYVHSLDLEEERAKAYEKLGKGPWALLCPGMRARIDVEGLKGKNPMERARYYVERAKELAFDGRWSIRPHPGDVYNAAFMQAYDYIVRALKGVLHRPDQYPLRMALAGADLVAGTSTTVFEALAFKRKVKPLAMPFAPKRPSIKQVFYKLDGQSAERVADVVEANVV